MTIEEEIFKRTKIDLEKIIEYGFKKDKDIYKYSKNILNNTFRVDIVIDNKGCVKGKVYDLAINEEYTNFRIKESTGSFIKKVRDEFKNVLEDIKDKCFTKEYFIYDQANRIAKVIKDKYGEEPEFAWEKFPFYGVFKNKNTNKWYGIIMNIDKSKLGENEDGEIEIIDVKLNSEEVECLLKKDGFYPAYHMNKKYWITIILNNTLSDELIMDLIQKSYFNSSNLKYNKNNL